MNNVEKWVFVILGMITLVQPAFAESRPGENAESASAVVAPVKPGVKEGVEQTVEPGDESSFQQSEGYAGIDKTLISEPRILMPGGETYSGEMHEDNPQGRGKMVYLNGDYFVGHFVDGQRMGHGTYWFANGDSLEGFWVNDRRIGEVSYRFGDGRHYMGMLKDDMPEGYGAMSYPDGSVYHGYWKAGRRNGEGYVESGSLTWVGEFEADQQRGQAWYIEEGRKARPVWCDAAGCSGAIAARLKYYWSMIRD